MAKPKSRKKESQVPIPFDEALKRVWASPPHHKKAKKKKKSRGTNKVGT
jgi:hypothetical protein